jgi:hypothetical protein
MGFSSSAEKGLKGLPAPVGPVLNVTIQEVKGSEPGRVIELAPDKPKSSSKARISSR